MTYATLAARAALEAPTVTAINMQVRTGTSVPFSPYMADGAAPTVDAVNMQVRTGTSVPFSPYMAAAGDTPTVEAVNMQVRTGTSVPFASYMTGDAKKAADKPVTEKK